MVLVLMIVFGTLPNTSLFWHEIQNTGHTLLFIPLVIFVILLLEDTTIFLKKKPFKLYIAACTISLLIGIVIELIQFVIDRDASIIDVVRDFAGIVTGLGLYLTTDSISQSHKPKLNKRARTGIITLSFFVFSAGLWPLFFLSAAYVQREIALPMIVDLSANWVQPFLHLKNASIRLADERESNIFEKDRLTRIDLQNGTYPGFSIIETVPNWSAYQTLKIAVYSKFDQPFNLVLRIHDIHHNHAYTDRFNTILTINKGTNYFHIPLEDIKKAPASRPMDMTHIKDITFFSARAAKGLYFYVGDMHLK